MPSFPMLHHTPIMVEAVRRSTLYTNSVSLVCFLGTVISYDFWMSLIADLMLPNSSPPTILPPLDIHWVSYREYCETRFSKLIGKAGIFDEENREYALMRCREIWSTIEGDLEKVATLFEKVKEKEFEETKKLWDRAFNQPYEKAGGEVPLTLEGVISIKSPVYWEDSGTDVNTKYRSFFQDFYWRSFVRYLGERKAASSGPRYGLQVEERNLALISCLWVVLDT
ncbi:hypothetical protein JHK87_039432 [Glycine soja]|nr:hypothetical protein JHK87_039432 [Glycine soja]